MVGRGTWTAVRDAKLVEMYRDGVPVAAISNTLGVSDAAARNRASRLGVANRREAKNQKLSKPGIQPMRFEQPREEYKGPLAALLRVWR